METRRDTAQRFIYAIGDDVALVDALNYGAYAHAAVKQTLSQYTQSRYPHCSLYCPLWHTFSLSHVETHTSSFHSSKPFPLSLQTQNQTPIQRFILRFTKSFPVERFLQEKSIPVKKSIVCVIFPTLSIYCYTDFSGNL